jgi:hypothetical protein
MFFFCGQLSKILNMFDQPKHCFRTKVVVFLPTLAADDGFLCENKCLRTKIHHLHSALNRFRQKLDSSNPLTPFVNSAQCLYIKLKLDLCICNVIFRIILTKKYQLYF